jgi:hypothetical protein
MPFCAGSKRTKISRLINALATSRRRHKNDAALKRLLLFCETAPVSESRRLIGFSRLRKYFTNTLSTKPTQTCPARSPTRKVKNAVVAYLIGVSTAFPTFRVYFGPACQVGGLKGFVLYPSCATKVAT